MEITELVRQKKFVVTAELGPPKGTSLDLFYKQAGYLKGLVHAANVTDGQSALMKMSSLGASRLLKEFGIEPIMQITCRDRNRIAIQSDLLSASALGIENLLVLTGDPIHIGDHPEAKPVFDIDAAELMATIKKMEGGSDMAGKALEGAPHFAIGAALNPCVENIETEISKTRKKIEKGAEFFQTQGVFEIARFQKFMERYRKEGFRVPVLAGIILLKSPKMARFMNEKIPGIFIPEPMISRLEKASDPRAECAQIACETIQKVRPLAQGVHLMAIGWEDLVPEIVAKSKISH
ncbi:MAG: methylenetetrahydrofolate reductase [Candidatus Omnitrophica bacterium]|nr:methylenetetrahydrofolate reductase [Candidatus Omnitrophota bacterium]